MKVPCGEKFEDTKEVIRSVNRRKTDNTMAKRYQRGNQNRKSKKDGQYNGQKIPKR